MKSKRNLDAIPKILSIKKKIGRTTYEVSMHFSKSSKESMEDKVERHIQNDYRKMK